MRIAAFDQDMTVESAHLWNREYTDCTEGTAGYRKHLALCDVCAQLVVRSALQAVERDIARLDIAFECSLCHLLRERPCHDQLISHLTEGQLAGGRIAAVESHKSIFVGVGILSFNLFFVHIRRNIVVDIQQSHRILADYSTNKFTQRPVNIYLAGYRNPLCGQTAVHIAGHKTELSLECRPALARDRYIFAVSLMVLDPVLQCNLILRQLCQDRRLLITGAQFFFHFFYNCRNPLVSCMLIKCLKQIQFRVLLNLHTQIVKLLDRSVACQEIQRTGTKADDLQAAQADDRSCNGTKFCDHIRTFFCCPDGIFRNICFHIAQLQIVAGIEHTAVRIPSSLDQVASSFFCSGYKHLRSVKMLCKQGLRNLRSEVSKIYHQSIAACFFDILQSLYHMDLTLHDADRTFINILFPVFCLISLHQGFPSGDRQALRKTISAHCYNTDLQFWHILHNMYSPFFFY